MNGIWDMYQLNGRIDLEKSSSQSGTLEEQHLTISSSSHLTTKLRKNYGLILDNQQKKKHTKKQSWRKKSSK